MNISNHELLVKAEIVKQLKLQGISKVELGERIGYKSSAIYDYMSRHKSNTMITRKVCHILGIDYDNVPERPVHCCGDKELRVEVYKWLWYNGISQHGIAEKYGINPRNIRTYMQGITNTPYIADILKAELHIPYTPDLKKNNKK